MSWLETGATEVMGLWGWGSRKKAIQKWPSCTFPRSQQPSCSRSYLLTWGSPCTCGFSEVRSLDSGTNFWNETVFCNLKKTQNFAVFPTVTKEIKSPVIVIQDQGKNFLYGVYYKGTMEEPWKNRIKDVTELICSCQNYQLYCVENKSPNLYHLSMNSGRSVTLKQKDVCYIQSYCKPWNIWTCKSLNTYNYITKSSKIYNQIHKNL